MRLMPSFLVLSALAALPALSGCATARSDHYADFTSWRGQVITTLRQHRDTDSLLAIALLPRSFGAPVDHQDPVVIEALNAAAAAAPENAAVAALRLMVCLEIADCDHATAATALQRVDPDNGVALWPELRSALQSGDESRIDVALTASVNSGSFNLHQNANVVAAVRSLATMKLPPPPGGEPETYVPHMMMAEMLGTYTTSTLTMLSTDPSLLDACRKGEAAGSRQRVCLQLLQIMMVSDVTILQMLGASLTCRLAPPGSPEVASARATIHRFKWLGDILLDPLKEEVRAGQTEAIQRHLDLQLETMRLHAREEDSRAAHVIAMGSAPEPPDDWIPTNQFVIGNCGRT